MHQKLFGSFSPIYNSIVTATPPDLPLGWTDEEIDYLQDRHAIDCVLIMRKHINQMFDEIYSKMNDSNTLAHFFPPCSSDEVGATY